MKIRILDLFVIIFRCEITPYNQLKIRKEIKPLIFILKSIAKRVNKVPKNKDSHIEI